MNDRGLRSEAPGLLRRAGRHAEAPPLLQHMFAGAVRALAQRELDEEGTIMREIVAHQMAHGRPHGA
jgi:hypothetical protein